jgi:hypothetical protein
MSDNWLKTLLQGAAESGMNLLAQNAAETPAQGRARSKKVAESCTPCAIRAKREAMRQRWRGQ